MKTIQIAPYKSDCRIEGKRVIGTMDGERTNLGGHFDSEEELNELLEEIK